MNTQWTLLSSLVTEAKRKPFCISLRLLGGEYYANRLRVNQSEILNSIYMYLYGTYYMFILNGIQKHNFLSQRGLPTRAYSNSCISCSFSKYSHAKMCLWKTQHLPCNVDFLATVKPTNSNRFFLQEMHYIFRTGITSV